MSEDTPEDLLFDLLAKSYYGQDGLGQTILGPAKNIRRFNVNNIKNYMDKYYTADNVVISIAGNVDEEMAEKLLSAANGNVKHVTYAPDMPSAEKLEEQIVAHGAWPAIGHTAANPQEVERAKAKGAKIVTHLFDAMGSWTGAHWDYGVQQDSAALIALAVPGLYYELILDSRGIHVPAYCAKMAYRAASEDHIILITDCVSDVSHNPNDYPPENKMSAPDLNFDAEGGLSGSRLVLSGACANFIRYAGGDVRTAFKCASTNPAKALGFEDKIGSILPGRDANIIFVDDTFDVKKVIFRGEEIA
jgi:N-acetylglucosamine-6-phosphate deacetylase